MHHTGAWDIRKEKFEQGLKKYRRDPNVRKALAACVEALATEENPERLGKRKVNQYAGLYGYRLSKSMRVIYQINYDTHQITLVTLGSHKEVYGSD